MFDIDYLKNELKKFNHNKNEVAKILLSVYGSPDGIDCYYYNNNHKEEYKMGEKTLAIVEIKIEKTLSSVRFTHSVSLCNELAEKYPNFKELMK